ncbi:hypothetical protein [Fibrella aquatica]|jgi:hypothetical protein|uniref:hypothetical protein n=1 Tax=Fibrella aquatica TaxID=3242487 RepID=UPI003522A77B
MIKEPKDIDFYTSGRQLSNQEFASISQWIATDKKKQVVKPVKGLKKGQAKLAQPKPIEND